MAKQLPRSIEFLSAAHRKAALKATTSPGLVLVPHAWDSAQPWSHYGVVLNGETRQVIGWMTRSSAERVHRGQTIEISITAMMPTREIMQKCTEFYPCRQERAREGGYDALTLWTNLDVTDEHEPGLGEADIRCHHAYYTIRAIIDDFGGLRKVRRWVFDDWAVEQAVPWQHDRRVSWKLLAEVRA